MASPSALAVDAKLELVYNHNNPLLASGSCTERNYFGAVLNDTSADVVVRQYCGVLVIPLCLLHPIQIWHPS